MSRPLLDDSSDDPTLRELEVLLKQQFFTDASHVHLDRLVETPVPFRYHHLSNKRIIRLFEMYPGSNERPIDGNLYHVPLKRTGCFEALSYTWGLPEKSCALYVSNGTARLSITESLHAALLRLRSRTSSRILWIDAICINQDDNDEKSTQVAIMGDIYSAASRVLCWLGEDNATRDGFETFRLLKNLRNVTFRDLSDKAITEQFMLSWDLPGKLDPRWLAVDRFFQRPWFCRGWVVQEIVHGRDVLMICGDSTLPAMDMHPAVEFLGDYYLIRWGTGFFPDKSIDGLNCVRGMLQLKLNKTTAGVLYEWCRHFTNSDEGAQRELQEGIIGRDPMIRELLTTVREMSTGTSLTMNQSGAGVELMRGLLASRGIEDRENRFSILALIRQFPLSLTSNPKDRFFSMLSLSADKDNPSLQPDYTEPTASTYTRYARHFLLEHTQPDGRRQRNVLISAGLANQQEESAMPSWVPDFSNFTKTTGLNGAGAMSLGYHASADTDNACQSTADDDTIVTRGGLIDTISWIMPDRDHKELDDYFDEVDRRILHRSRPYPRLAPAETLLDVQWRTLIANTDTRGQIALDTLRDSYFEDRRFLLDLLKNAEFRDQVRKAPIPASSFTNLGEWGSRWLSLLATGCLLCETEGGLVGLVPSSVQVGDQVRVVFGESMPFLLRPVAESRRKFTLIGAGYIHGIMQGEALESESWKEEEIYLV